MKTEIFEELGLTKSEIKIYLALLELKSESKSSLVKKSGIASSKFYEIMDKLMAKGLASYIIVSGVKHYNATPPRRILDYFIKRN